MKTNWETYKKIIQIIPANGYTLKFREESGDWVAKVVAFALCECGEKNKITGEIAYHSEYVFPVIFNDLDLGVVEEQDNTMLLFEGKPAYYYGKYKNHNIITSIGGVPITEAKKE